MVHCGLIPGLGETSINAQLQQTKSWSWKQNPEAVKADILAVAREEFAEHGLSGARIKKIVERTKSSKRMVFYYLGDEEGLYRAVMEEAYESVRRQEKELDLNGLPPDRALLRLVEFTFDHHRANPEFIRLVAIENIHRGRHMADMSDLADLNSAAIETLERICAAGVAEGVFRPDVSPLVLHWQISAVCYFNVANRHTFGQNFGGGQFSETAQAEQRPSIARSVLEGARSRA